ncbi:thioredoxin family protein [Aquimarina litoralis]|uniref:thioredoxin family protein n=1 Tax=Aquimarina litoralis TaxID=584605 RepID=UPI001FE7DDD1|nr:thioredoxin family protein [Aquimarina litoralis]
MNKIAPFILVLTLMISTNVISQDWKYDFDEAKKIAKEKNQNIVLLFTGSDWCPPCIKLERKIFSNSEFQEFADEKFVWVKADFPSAKRTGYQKNKRKKIML